ncbi:MAG: NAD(P)H-dependent oxidoreductase [Desulfosarcina sp.]|nr:NAD(P)H-dependent oxidoreductase [Desulfobacterales bacterium]
MKILAVNSSPRKEEHSKTALMLQHLVEGMQAAGGQVEVVHLRTRKIKRCIGCFACWTQTPGHCIHKDDMTLDIFPRWAAADLAVYATPLYYHTMNSAMSTFMERTLPAVEPFFELDRGCTYHPLRFPTPAVVWLSVCGFPEEAEFDAFSEFIRRTNHRDINIVAEIYRPAAETMASPLFEEQKRDILEATRQAGAELVDGMRVSPATMAQIRQPLGDPRMHAEIGNTFWKTCIAEGLTPRQFKARHMVPRPDSMDAFRYFFPIGLNAAAAGQRRVLLQFEFHGAQKGTCHFAIEGGQIEGKSGAARRPDIAITTPFDLWMDIMTGKADGQQMFMAQKYTVEGDLDLMIKLFQRDVP